MSHIQKIIGLLLLIFFIPDANCQKPIIIQGIILDSETQDPVPNVYITDQEKTIGVSSDDQGNFMFILGIFARTDSIAFQCLGYQSHNLPIEIALNQDTFVMDPEAYTLSPIVIREDRKKIRAKSLFKEAVRQYNKDKVDGNHIALGIYSEKAKYQGDWIMYMESLGYSVHTLLRKDAASLSNYNFLCDQTRAYVTNPEWKKYTENIKEPNTSETVLNGSAISLHFIRRLENRGVLSGKRTLRYRCDLDSLYSIKGIPVYVISFSGNNEDGIMEIMNDGGMFLIQSIDIKTDRYWSTAFRITLPADAHIEFEYYKNAPFISKVESHYSHDGLDYYNSLGIIMQKLISFPFDKDTYWAVYTLSIMPYISFNSAKAAKFHMNERPEYLKTKQAFANQGISLPEEFSKFTDRWFFNDEEYSEQLRLVSPLKKLF